MHVGILSKGASRGASFALLLTVGVLLSACASPAYSFDVKVQVAPGAEVLKVASLSVAELNQRRGLPLGTDLFAGPAPRPPRGNPFGGAGTLSLDSIEPTPTPTPHFSHVVTAPVSIAFGTVFPGEGVPSAITVSLSGEAPGATYRISLSGGNIVDCPAVPVPSATSPCLAFVQAPAEALEGDTLACGTLADPGDTSDSWDLTLFVRSALPGLDYSTDILIEANNADGDPCA